MPEFDPATDTCWNIEWVQENNLSMGTDLAWARSMWYCPCPDCV